MKTCTKCKTWRDLTEFGKDKNRRDGLNPHCKHCTRLASSNWQRNNPDKARARLRKFHAENPDAQTEYNRSYYSKTADQHRKRARQYQIDNPAKVAAREAKRRATKLQATPAWANFDEIRRMYENAYWVSIATGVQHHVDHIVPLQSKLVCGLHWEGNLQVLPATENINKNNRRWPDMP